MDAADRHPSLRQAVRAVPAGRWGVAVSGGADSTALLHLLDHAAGVDRVVIHVDHQLRGLASDADAAFVAALAKQLNLPLALFRRADLEAEATDLPANPSARYRRLRLLAYGKAGDQFGLAGVILAHHADDVAETLLLRLLRGSARSGTLGLSPLKADQTVAGVRLLRPLLPVGRNRLRRYLLRTGNAWREDASNTRNISARNRLRKLLVVRPDLRDAALNLADSASTAEIELDALTPDLPEPLFSEAIAGLPEPLARRAARRWLVARGVPERDASPACVDRLLSLLDPASPRAMQFPGGLRVIRRRGELHAERSSDASSAEGRAPA